MSDLFVILLLLSLVGLIVGLISPRLAVRWGSRRTRGKVVSTYGLAMIVFFILFGVTAPTLEQPAENVEKQKQEQVEPAQEQVEPAQEQVEPTQEANIALERTPAQSNEELAKTISEIIKMTDSVETSSLSSVDVSAGVDLFIEVEMLDIEKIWQVARNGILAAYLNKGNVNLIIASVHITTPEAMSHTLQVFVGQDQINEELLTTLKNGNENDFKDWIKKNNQSYAVFIDVFDATPSAVLRVQGPFAVDKEDRELREEKIGEQFSIWDGAHHNLVRAVKEVMLNPRSFEHVETEYWDMEDHLVVIMTFRGTNQFGAIVPNVVKAWVDLDGNLQKWEWLE